MGSLFALVLTVSMTDGTYQDAVIGVYDSQQQCENAATEQRIMGSCYPVDGVIHHEQPAEEYITE